VSQELVLLLVLPLVWAIGWMMAFQWMKIRWMIQLNHLKKETRLAQELVLELQRTQEDWLRRDSRLAMDHSLRLLRPREQE
jgi:hypothetical protein